MLAAETDNLWAYVSLKQAVLSGVFKPGAAVTLALVDTPVREAVKPLISEGRSRCSMTTAAFCEIFDRNSFDPDYPTLAEFQSVVRRLFGGPPSRTNLTRLDEL
jgi:hypothetical protein